MGRISTREKKNEFQKAREEKNLTRSRASELLGGISQERIVRIESGEYLPTPWEVLQMSKAYGKPELCNKYCSGMCEIGRQYVPEIQMKELSSIVLEMLANLNAVSRMKERLIEITYDGKIADGEIRDFLEIQDILEKISVTVETLQLWSENMIASGQINKEEYARIKQERLEKSHE